MRAQTQLKVAMVFVEGLAGKTRELAERWIGPISLVGSVIITFAIYRRVLGYGFFFDDSLDLTRTEGRSYWSLLSSSQGYSYYRPLPFLLWKFSYRIFGRYDPMLLHVLPVLLHALAGWLFFLLIRRLGAGLWAAFPAVLFLTYPFSYQDVAIVGVVFHPLATAAILASLNLYHLARRSQGRRAHTFHLLGVLATATALWSHESGVMVLPAMLGLEALILIRRRQRRSDVWLAPHVALTALFLIVWSTVDKAPFDQSAGLSDVHPKALFFAQGFTYAGAAQINWLQDQVGFAPGLLEVAVASAVLVFGSYLAAGWMRGKRGLALLPGLAFPLAGLTVALVASLPALLRLEWDYVIDAPRLLYQGSIGAALFWGLLPALDFGRKRLTVLWRVATTGLLLAVMAQAWIFVDLRMDMFDQASSAVDGITAAGEAHPDQTLIFVNMPAWLAQSAYEYPYGHLGVQVAPTYIGLDRVIYTNSKRHVNVNTVSVAIAPDTSGGRFTFGPHGSTLSAERLDQFLRSGAEVVGVVRASSGFSAIEAGRLVEDGAIVSAPQGESSATSFEISAFRSTSRHGGLTIFLSWNVLQAAGEDAEVVLDLESFDGTRISGYAGNALQQTSNPRLWQAGDRIDDVVYFQNLPAGRYVALAGLRDRTTGQMLNPGRLPLGFVTVGDAPMEFGR